jgi:hypothetical protein
LGGGGGNRPIKLIVTNRQLAILTSQQWVADSAEVCRLRQLVNKNTWSCVRCIRSMHRSFWPLLLEQTVILPAMSNYFRSYTQIIGRPSQKGKLINVNYWWNMGDTSTKSWYFINDWYFYFIPVIMVLYIYKYWFKMLKRWKFPPLIKACALSTNCTMGNLNCSRHATYNVLTCTGTYNLC